MSSKEDGVMIVLSSPSGAGKTTLTKLLSTNSNYLISISHTTRKPRINEIDGKDYYFVNEKEFKSLINKNEFLEYAQVFKNFYGTTILPVTDGLKKGKNIIFDIDWQGTEQIIQKKLNYKIFTIFILPPSKEELFKRLLNRDQNDEKIANERMQQFKKDVLHWKDYDFVVINDDLQKCYNQIINFIEKKSKLKSTYAYDKNHIEQHIEKLLK